MAKTPSFPAVYLARHGETLWAASGRHTGRTDVPLTEQGERSARQLGERLRAQSFSKILTSPLQRASRTCALAGFGDFARIEGGLVEWDYGEYEGRTTNEIEGERPGWDVFRDGCPGGESAADVGRRADEIINGIRGVTGDVLLFSHGHFLRVLAARWLGLDPRIGRYLLLDTAALSIVGYHYGWDDPVICLWNDRGHTG